MAASTSWRRTAAASFSLLAASTLGASEPYLVRDIDPRPGSEVGSGASPLRVGDRIFVLAADDDHGAELWITDGTAAGTRLVRDICPGTCGAEPVVQGSLGDRLLFSARTTATGLHRLWISDGTWEGTRPLGSGPILREAPVGGLTDRGLFFFAAVHEDGTGLWVTDGTRAGTRPLGLAGPDGWPRPVTFSGDPAARGALVFSAIGETGAEPWVTDGTDAGTRQLFTPQTAEAHQSPQHLRLLPAGTIFFTLASQEPCGITLWVSDGTTPGTRPIRVFDDPGCRGEVDPPVLVSGGAVYFVAGEGTQPWQLWVSDGTAAGTRAVTSFTHPAFIYSSDSRVAATDQAVLFVAYDNLSGFEPWIADAAGARLLADICPGSCSSFPEDVASLGDRFYFAADDLEHGEEPWTSDGTAAGTKRIVDVCPGSCGSRPGPYALAGDLVYFTADHSLADFERELWSAPIAGGDAVRLTDFPPELAFGSSFTAVDIGDDLLFSADDGEHGLELWRTDGTPSGTNLLTDLSTFPLPGSGSFPAGTLAWGDRAFFFATEPDVGYQPWVSDGTEEGTRRLGLVATEPLSNIPYSKPVLLGDEVVFVAASTAGGPLELWSTAGDAAPVRLAELAGTGALSSLIDLVRLGDRVVAMVQASSTSESGVWVSDGTPLGTRRLAGITTANLGFGDFTGELDGELFFSGAIAGSQDFELWATDGTDAGTRRVADIAAGSFPSVPREFARVGDRLIFSAESEAAGRELWVTGGTAAGTQMIADRVPGVIGSFPRRPSVIGERAVFIARDGTGFDTLWVSDGTAAGTVPLSEIPGGVLGASRAVANGRVFLRFEQFTPNHRFDLWVTDGTGAGTGSLGPLLPPDVHIGPVWSAGDRVRVAITYPGPVASVQELWETDGTLAGTRKLLSIEAFGFSGGLDHLAQVGSLLFFQGPHPEAGAELMALPLGPAEPCSADAETLCLGGGRFAVRAHWRDPRTGDTGTAGALPLPGSDRTGLFWFFAPDNVELVVKNLAAGPVNGYFWNFYGALSDVEYEIEVTDTATGRKVEYFNPGGEICGRGDTKAFPARPPVPLPVPAPAAAPIRSLAAGGASGTACGGSAGDLCLLGDRFRVEVEWTDQRSGDTGVGTAIPYADRSGFFWFFDSENVELAVKMIDGRQVNGRLWFFYGALSDVEYTITVTDNETEQQASYHNPPGEICGRGDTAAF